MNVIKFNSYKSQIAFCLIDNTHRYESAYTKELMKNIADFTISNIWLKGYDLFQSQNEDCLLRTVSDLGYKHAVVLSTGTEFINGLSFFDEIEKLVTHDYCLYGHILDRGNAYYELHHQCYLLNLDIYRRLGCPDIGTTNLNSRHNQIKPARSIENIHDDYTPLWIRKSDQIDSYCHKLHGWNIISKILEQRLKINAFDQEVRSNKKHYYPENQKEFLTHISWAISRYNQCCSDFVHDQNTEVISLDKKYKQIITPASGSWFVDYLDTSEAASVIYYDYNQKALDYWKKNAPLINNVHYEFVKIDLLGMYDINDLIKNFQENTIINLSNIFCYEGTAMFSSLEYRLKKEKEILRSIPDNWDILFTGRSASGFTGDFRDLRISELKKPTWHFGSDWHD